MGIRKGPSVHRQPIRLRKPDFKETDVETAKVQEVPQKKGIENVESEVVHGGTSAAQGLASSTGLAQELSRALSKALVEGSAYKGSVVDAYAAIAEVGAKADAGSAAGLQVRVEARGKDNKLLSKKTVGELQEQLHDRLPKILEGSPDQIDDNFRQLAQSLQPFVKLAHKQRTKMENEVRSEHGWMMFDAAPSSVKKKYLRVKGFEDQVEAALRLATAAHTAKTSPERLDSERADKSVQEMKASLSDPPTEGDLQRIEDLITDLRGAKQEASALAQVELLFRKDEAVHTSFDVGLIGGMRGEEGLVGALKEMVKDYGFIDWTAKAFDAAEGKATKLLAEAQDAHLSAQNPVFAKACEAANTFAPVAKASATLQRNLEWVVSGGAEELAKSSASVEKYKNSQPKRVRSSDSAYEERKNRGFLAKHTIWSNSMFNAGNIHRDNRRSMSDALHGIARSVEALQGAELAGDLGAMLDKNALSTLGDSLRGLDLDDVDTLNTPRAQKMEAAFTQLQPFFEQAAAHNVELTAAYEQTKS
jgi:hypothetical protein